VTRINEERITKDEDRNFNHFAHPSAKVHGASFYADCHKKYGLTKKLKCILRNPAACKKYVRESSLLVANSVSRFDTRVKCLKKFLVLHDFACFFARRVFFIVVPIFLF
jgi:hypothetical protein